MISVAYDVTSLAQNRFGGIAQVCHHTLKQAALSQAVDPVAIYRRGDPGNIDVDGVPRRPVNWLDHLCLRKYDIIHALGHRIPPARCGRLVYTLHDAWSLYPNRYQSDDFQKGIGPRMLSELRQADAIVCVSEATRTRLRELELVDPSRCHVVRNGVEVPVGAPEADPSPKMASLLTQPYVLFVGRVEARKNLEHVVAAVCPSHDLHLVIVGDRGFGGEAIGRDTLSRMPTERLHHFRDISRNDLDLLYRHALALLQPSWEEGFGLPLAEAMIRGCPVITSNCSASAEVVAEGGILVDPVESDQSREALEKLAADEPYRQEVIAAGRTRAAQFSWSKYFAGLEKIYRLIAA